MRARPWMLLLVTVPLAVALVTVGPSDLGAAVAVTVLLAAPLALTVWAVLDIAHRPQWAWALAGRRQVVWLAVVLVGVVTVVGGVCVSGWYLLRVRPEIAAAESGRIAG